MRILSFSATGEWFFVTNEPDGQETIYRLAGYGVIERISGQCEVVGMIPAVRGGEARDFGSKAECALVPVPAVKGTYKHANELSRQQMISAK